MTMRDKIAKIVACQSGNMSATSAIIAALPDSEVQKRIDAALNTPSSALKEIRELKARITELERELSHCIYEIERDGSRKSSMVRRAAFAREALKGDANEG